MLQFSGDLLASLSVPAPRAADNLVNRALSQTVESDDLNIPKPVQDLLQPEMESSYTLCSPCKEI